MRRHVTLIAFGIHALWMMVDNGNSTSLTQVIAICAFWVAAMIHAKNDDDI